VGSRAICLDKRGGYGLGLWEADRVVRANAARLAAFIRRASLSRPCLFLLRAMSQRNAVNRAHQGSQAT